MRSKVQCGSISRTTSTALALAVVLLIVVVVSQSAQAQTYEVLHRFHGKDGGAPFAGVIRDAAGNLYGTTADGGDLNCTPPYGCGVVFKLSPTRKETVLHTFTGGADGGEPLTGFLLRDAAGNLYGTTIHGGDLNCPPLIQPYGCGVVFKLDTTGKETVLYSFTEDADGSGPNAGLIPDAAGNLYGTTQNGGDLNCFPKGGGCGVVFKLNTTTRKETVLHAFTGGADGSGPNAGLIRDAAGNLYGTAESGGTYGYGVVFKVSTTRELTVLYAFTGGADGAAPFANLILDTAGNLYGTTEQGGDLNCFPPYGCGVVFKLDTTGKETVLHTFTGRADGGFPVAGLLREAPGNLYGTTEQGGDLNCFPPYGCGVVFKLDTTGKETVLHTFTGGADGGLPYAGVIRDAAGNLYGTTPSGGDLNCGTLGGCGVVFKLTP